jgi:5-oxoprolinase (ATP-hydrolysing)
LTHIDNDNGIAGREELRITATQSRISI